jgi:hypothetical protein
MRLECWLHLWLPVLQYVADKAIQSLQEVKRKLRVELIIKIKSNESAYLVSRHPEVEGANLRGSRPTLVIGKDITKESFKLTPS